MPESPDVPLRREPSGPSEHKSERPPQRYVIERIPEAPLIERKIYVATRTPVFATRDGLIRYLVAKKDQGDTRLEDFGGQSLARVPMVGRVVREDGRVNGALLADSNGVGIGWLQLGESAYEWSTNHVYRPRSADLPPQVFHNKEDAIQGEREHRFPKNLWDDDIVFPLLERDVEKGVFKIGHPLPRTIETDETFPLWISDKKYGAKTSQLLVAKMDVQMTIRSLQYIKENWNRLKDDPRDSASRDVQRFLEAHQLTLLTLVTGNLAARPEGEGNAEWAALINTTAGFLATSGLDVEFLHKTCDDIGVMSNEDFADFVQDIQAVIDWLQEALQNSPSYSLFNDGKIERRVVCSASL